MCEHKHSQNNEAVAFQQIIITKGRIWFQQMFWSCLYTV